LSVDAGVGLSHSEARVRLEQQGPNELRQQATRSPWAIFISQFKSLVVLLLVGAALLSFILGDFTEGFAVIGVILINAGIGFFTEIKATRSMAALYKMGSMTTRVRREGGVVEIPATELVPGDIVVLEGGDIITADLRIVEASKLECDESALTGESAPVSKHTEPLDADQPLADRRNMLYKGTSLTRGSGVAVVVSTAMDTELGRISALVEGAEEETTPLEENLDALGRNLAKVVFFITLAVWILGVARGKAIFTMLETAIALAVASIPEGLPVVATIALSRGMMRMAQRQALVRRLASVETLGSTNVICTDKTGTLTENKMTVTRLDLADGVVERKDGAWPAQAGETALEAIRIAVLCNNASIRRQADGTTVATGDPMEIALLEAGLEMGIDRLTLVTEMPELNEDAFDSETKRMATYHRIGNGYYVAAKGAPEAIWATCARVLTAEGEQPFTDALRAQWEQTNERVGRRGFRLLAVARNRVASLDDDPYENLVFVGLLGMIDPPRGDIRDAIARCREAGIRVVMITGDQAPTALHIGTDVGILDSTEAPVIHGRDLKPFAEMSSEEKDRVHATNVFARVTPHQKLDLITLHQERGAVVAMTGDGVNDAPALKKADIGIAMGLRGTQVACQAAHVVLKNDSFATIVHAVQEGRVIFGNIRNFVLYLLSCNIAEVLVIFLAALLNTPLPVLPLQILLLNLVTDVFPALALGVGEGSARVMKHPLRPKSDPMLSRRHWAWISMAGTILGTCTLASFALAHYVLKIDADPAQPVESVTVCFLTLAFSQLFHVFSIREHGASIINNAITRNGYVWAAFLLCTTILLASVYVPAFSHVLHTAPLSLKGWAIVLPLSFAPVPIDTFLRLVFPAMRRKPATPASS